MPFETEHAFTELPADLFPFTINVHDTVTGELLQSIPVTGPGAIEVQGFGRDTTVVIEENNGRYQWHNKSLE